MLYDIQPPAQHAVLAAQRVEYGQKKLKSIMPTQIAATTLKISSPCWHQMNLTSYTNCVTGATRKWTYGPTQFRRITSATRAGLHATDTPWHARINFLTYSDDHASQQSGLCPSRERSLSGGRGKYADLPNISNSFEMAMAHGRHRG